LFINQARRIGVLMPGDENDPLRKRQVSAFTQGLADLGWTDGRNVRMELRWGRDDINRIRALARELVGLQPDIIMTNGTPEIVALQRETRTIPSTSVTGTDAVASGIIARLDRPSGNITGFAVYEATLGGKWLELLSEIAPGLKRAAIMFNPDTTPAALYLPSLEAAARSLKIAPIIVPVHSDVEIETAIVGLGREPRGGLVVIPDGFMTARRAPLVMAVARNNIPAVYPNPAYARDAIFAFEQSMEPRCRPGPASPSSIAATRCGPASSRGSTSPGGADRRLLFPHLVTIAADVLVCRAVTPRDGGSGEIFSHSQRAAGRPWSPRVCRNGRIHGSRQRQMHDR
jgi:ABC-type uncharacterized transport system substrate-binding protein